MLKWQSMSVAQLQNAVGYVNFSPRVKPSFPSFVCIVSLSVLRHSSWCPSYLARACKEQGCGNNELFYSFIILDE